MIDQNSVYMCIGLSDGNVWVIDTRSNYALYQTKVMDCEISKIVSSVSRIVIEGKSDTKIHSWELEKTIDDFDYDASDPKYFFHGKEQSLSIDGYPSATDYDDIAS